MTEEREKNNNNKKAKPGEDMKAKILSYLTGEVEISSLEEELVKTGTFHAYASRELINAMTHLAQKSVERDRIEAELSTTARTELEIEGKVTEKKVEERVRMNPLWQNTELAYQLAKVEVDAWKSILRSLEIRREVIQFFLRGEIKQ